MNPADKIKTLGMSDAERGYCLNCHRDVKSGSENCDCLQDSCLFVPAIRPPLEVNRYESDDQRKIKMLHQSLCVAREALRAPINEWKGDCERLALGVINDVLATSDHIVEPAEKVRVVTP